MRKGVVMSLTHMELRRLHVSDHELIHQVVAILRDTYHTEVSKFFIYHDVNYPHYLKTSLIDKKRFWVYYLICPDERKIMGFAMLRIYKERLFLNQLIVLPEFRGKNLSEHILKGVLESLLNEFGEKAFTDFELETFASNIGAKIIYERLGMISSAGSNWYDGNSLLDVKLEEELPKCSLNKDQYGFLQLSLNGKEIGTVINAKLVKINIDHTKMADVPIHFVNSVFPNNHICLVSKQQLVLPLLDYTINYSLSIPRFKEMLHKEKPKS